MLERQAAALARSCSGRGVTATPKTGLPSASRKETAVHGIRRRPWLVSLLAIWLLVPPVRPIHAQEEPEPPPPPEAPAPEASEAPAPPEAPEATATPPRLSYLHGDVSFWRPGAEDWAAARVNTPLAGGDSLYVPQGGNVEVQAGPRAFVRAGGETDLGFDAVEPDFLQLKVTSGHAAIDLRNLERGHTVEVDTPHLAATIDQPGYYRVDVDQEATTFISRRGGSASVVPPGADALDLGANGEWMGLGAVSLRSLGPRRQCAGMGGGPDRRGARVRARARRLLRWEWGLGVDRYRGARGQLGPARLGRAVHSVVGTARVHRGPVVGRV